MTEMEDAVQGAPPGDTDVKVQELYRVVISKRDKERIDPLIRRLSDTLFTDDSSPALCMVAMMIAVNRVIETAPEHIRREEMQSLCMSLLMGNFEFGEGEVH